MNAKASNAAPSATVASAEKTEAAVATSSAPKKFDPKALKVVKVLTLPLIKLKPGVEVYIIPTEAMHKAKPQKNAPALKEGEKAPEPPTLLHCINLETGDPVQIIPGGILQDILNDDYPGNGYVGKAFYIKVGEKKGGTGGRSAYNTYTVSEIEVPK